MGIEERAEESPAKPDGSAMASITVKRKCPDLIFVAPRFDAYEAISLQIREIFAAYTPIIEPLSLDEAYLDVTENLERINSATQIAEEIRAKIGVETGLTASARVSYNKFLAKLASDHRKPDGLLVITPKMGPEFVETLPVRKFHGVGPATAARMGRLGIKTRLPADLFTYQAARDALQGNRRQSLAALRRLGYSRPHTHAQGQVRQLPADHAEPYRPNANRDARRTRTARQRAARTSLSCRERRSAHRRLVVFTRGRV